MHEQRDGPKVVKSRQDEPIPGPREDFATVWHRPDATCDNTTSFSSRNLLSYPLPFKHLCCVLSTVSDGNPRFSLPIVYIMYLLPLWSIDLNCSLPLWHSNSFFVFFEEKRINFQMKRDLNLKNEKKRKIFNIGLQSLEGYSSYYISIYSHAHSSKCVSTNLDHVCSLSSTLFIMIIVKTLPALFSFLLLLFHYYFTIYCKLSWNFHSLHLYELDIRLDRSRVVDTHLALTPSCPCDVAAFRIVYPL